MSMEIPPNGCDIWAPAVVQWDVAWFSPKTPPPPAPADARLSLYYYWTCGYCRVVIRAIEELDVNVELRDIRGDPEHRRALVTARGRGRVPVLLVESSTEPPNWMPESRDIVRFLKANFG